MINDYEATKPITTDTEISDGEISRDDVISCLNDLIVTAKDGQDGFREAADGVDAAELKTFFDEASRERGQFVSELQGLVSTYGGDAETEGSTLGAAHRGWMDLKAAVTGNDSKDILTECERGEDSAKAAYKDALENRLPQDVSSVVARQYQAVIACHDRVKAMRDGASHEQSRHAGGLG